MMDDILPRNESLPCRLLNALKRCASVSKRLGSRATSRRSKTTWARFRAPNEVNCFESCYCWSSITVGAATEQPAPDEYQARFPQDSQLVSDVFDKLSTDARGWRDHFLFGRL
jgi:hypothetical protein